MATRSRSKAATPQVPMTTYVLTMRDGMGKKVTVPSNWKVTFGPIVPGSKDGGLNSTGATCLRFYEGKDQQRAIFTGVESFRDSSIAILEEVEQRKQDIYRREGEEGGEAVVMEARVRQWVNPDDPGAMQRAAAAFVGAGSSARNQAGQLRIFADAGREPSPVRTVFDNERG